VSGCFCFVLFLKMHMNIWENHHEDHRKNKRAFGDKRRSILTWISKLRHSAAHHTGIRSNHERLHLFLSDNV